MTPWFFVVYHFVSLYIEGGLIHIYLDLFDISIYIRKNITAHCTPPFAHTFHTVSISLLVNMVSKHIKWYDTDQPFRIPHFPLLFENVMLCKTITYYDQAAIVFQYVFFLGTSIVSEAVCAIFLPRVIPLYMTTAWNICESKEKPFNMRIYLWFTKVMFYWNSLQKTMSGSFNITENKTQEYTNDDQKWKKQVSMYAEALLWKPIIIHSAI